MDVIGGGLAVPAEADRKVRREEEAVGESRVTHEAKRRGVSAGAIQPDIGKGCRKLDGFLRGMHVDMKIAADDVCICSNMA